MTKAMSAHRWANDIANILNTVFGVDHFPVNVKEIALEFSSKKYPSDPISLINGGNIPGFEGCLVPAPPGKKG